MSIKDTIDKHIKDIAKQVYDELKPQQEPQEDYMLCKLPEIDRNKLLAMSIQKTHKDIKAVLPAGVAMDACCDTSKFNSFYNITNPVDDIIYTHFATQGFIGFQACALLCQNWLINKACTLPAKDAIRPDYDLSYATEADAENLDKDFLAKITNISNDPKGYDIKKVCKLFAEKKRQYGQVLAYPIVEGADYSNPFNIDGITPDSYKGMTVIDPIWYVGELDEEAINDPTSLRYFKPTYFRMPNGVKLHHSWCIFGITSEVPDVLKPTYYWGGYPIPQLIYKRVYAAEKTANEAPMLAMSKRLLVADINVQGYLANPQKTDEQLKAISMFRDNYGVMTKRPGDSVQQIDTSLTDLDEVIMTQYQLVAAAANIPATKLLETQPKGFNSTGDYEDDQYKLLLTSIQEDDFVPLLSFHYALLSKSKYGIVRDYTINFSEIDTPTEKERAEINSMEAQTAAVLVNAGVISPDEVRNKLIKNPDSGFNDIEDDLPEDELPFDDEEGGSLSDLVDDPNISPSEAATLNGVQVTSMANIASQVAKGELSRESAVAILEKSFNLSEQEANAIIGEQKLPQQEGNGETQQDPFSMDEEPKRWITTKNDVKVPVGEGENNKEACNEFFEDKEQHEKDMKNSFNAQSDMMTLLAMDYPEFKKTVSEINTLYKSKYKNKKKIKHITSGFIYKAKNHSFNNYEFYDKIINDDTRKDWG